MNNMAQTTGLPGKGKSWVAELWQKEDWWAIWIGLGLVVAALVMFQSGGSIKWIAVSTKGWTDVGELVAQLRDNALRHVAHFALWAVLFTVAGAVMGRPPRQFFLSFVFVYVGAAIISFVGAWKTAQTYQLEPPLLALLAGLVISNTMRLPEWLQTAFRVELFVKVGIVLLGATLPFTLVLWAGPVAILQASIVSITTFLVIFWAAKAFGLDPKFAATLGVGGAVCGVSGAIAIAGAVGARKEHPPVAISIVIIWAVVMIFALPFVSQALGLHTAVAGAWIGSSEFADAAGFAAASAYGNLGGKAPGIEGTADQSILAFTLMKVIGRDVWIGLWAFILAIVATTRWDTSLTRKTDASEIWRRFPKFVLGFLAASIIITLVSQGYSYESFKKEVAGPLVGPIKELRSWAFIFCFFGIGLTTRFRSLSGFTFKPFAAFTIGVAVNVVLGLVLSAVVFADYWKSLAL